MLAMPLDNDAVPRDVAPSKNVTVPVGAFAPVPALTVAVKVADEFCVTVVVDEVRVVVVLSAADAAGFTLMTTMPEIEALNATVPEYAALIESVPVGRDEVAREALPAERTADPSRADPL